MCQLTCHHRGALALCILNCYAIITASALHRGVKIPHRLKEERKIRKQNMKALKHPQQPIVSTHKTKYKRKDCQQGDHYTTKSSSRRVKPSPFATLTAKEINDIYDTMLSDPTLNLVTVDEAEVSDSYISMMELAVPNKDEVRAATLPPIYRNMSV